MNNPDVLKELEKGLEYKLIQNKVHTRINELSRDIFKQLPVEQVNQLCDEAVKQPEEKMEEVNKEDLMTTLSDILALSENINTSCSSSYRPVDDKDTFN